MSEHVAVGDRVAQRRKVLGLTQAQLATRAHLSLSLIRKVEQGGVPASPAFVAAASRALGASVGDLLGQPVVPTTRADHQVFSGLAALRREFAAYRLPPDEDVVPRTAAELEAAVRNASERRHAVDLTRLGEGLPGLLAELRAASFAAVDDDRPRLYALLAESYYAAGQLASKLGHTDLASLSVDRYEWAAARSDDHLAVLVGDYRRAGDLIVGADWAGAQRLLDGARRTIEDRVGGGDPPTLSMWGNLHLKSALAAARAGDRAGADAHLAEARETAARIGVDRDDYRLCFGPTNVTIWSVGLAVEAGDGTTAITRAQGFQPPAAAPRERVGHHWIDLARAYLLHGDHARCLATLQQARRTAPQQTRYHPMVAETVRGLVRAQRRRSDSLSGFAGWLGVAC